MRTVSLKVTLRSAAQSVADAIWPRECILCGADDPAIAGEVCRTCWGRFLPAEGRRAPKPLHRLEVAFAYDSTLKQILHRYKFEHAVKLGGPLGQRFADRLEEMRFHLGASVLVPVPDHPTRRRERGYNPRYELARQIADRWERPLWDKVVRRLRYGPHQSNLPESERKRMPGDTFIADPPAPGRETTPILLVDDVVSTGTTLARCAAALKKAGWQRVDAVCLSG